MAIKQNKQAQQGNASTTDKGINKAGENGIVTVNDSGNPTPEERDAQIPNEPGTERLRSERQSVKDTQHPE